MPLQKLQFRPGLNREGTDYSNEGGWYDGDKIRFRSGFPEKIGGWTRLSNETFLGICRSLWNWINIGGSNYLGVGTNLKYYIEYSGDYNDITPIVHTSTALGAAAGPFTATSGSSTIRITDSTYEPEIGDYIIISGAVTLGGNITAAVLNQEYTVSSVISPTVYTIEAKSPTTGLPVLANGSDTGKGGATVKVEYQYPVGLDVYTFGLGWGAGAWPTFNTATLTNPFTSTSPSTTVTVTQTAHGLSNGDAVYFSSISGNVCGIASAPFIKAFLITVANANAYTFSTVIGVAPGPVNTYTTSNNGPTGGSVTVFTPAPPTRGWGDPAGDGVGLQLRLWTNDNYGQDLVIAARGGQIAYWENASGVGSRAVLLSDLATAKTFDGAYVPVATNQVVASAIQRFVICMGANSYVDGDPDTPFNPMIVRWSDQENPYQWVPSVTNQSGEFPLSNGSYIMCARNTRQEILIWTDSAIYSMQYLGPPYIWGFQILMDNISIMSPNAAVTVNNVTYWMGADKFYTYSGRVETLPCSLWQYVFNDINKDQGYQVFCGTNEGYSEIWWFYCSGTSTTVDKYVIYNYLERNWYYGTMARTAWLDSGIRQYPMAADYNNRILYHESSVDDVAGLDAVPINAYVQSSDFDIGDGHNFGFVWRILPDINFNGSSADNPSVTMTVRPRRNSGAPYGVADNPRVTSSDNYSTSNVYNIQEFTGQVYTRLRGRQLAFRIESNTLGTQWQLGSPRIDIRNDGRR
jgi:hypothetical protein